MVLGRVGKAKKIAVLILFSIGISGCALAPGTRSPSGDVVENQFGDIQVIPISDKNVNPKSDNKETTTRNSVDRVDQDYRIGPRDVLRIIVWNNPQLMATASGDNVIGFEVQADGSFFFPYAGKIRAAGLTLNDVRTQLTRRLSSVMKTPQVSVSVLSYGNQKIYVLGAVEKPGLLPLEGYPISIMEAISRAGGLTDQASGLKAYLLRDGKRIDIDLDALLHKGDMRQNFVLRNGDVLRIPDNRSEKVYIMGAVKQPKSVLMTAGSLSLSEAIMDGGGLDETTSDASNVYVIRVLKGKTKIYHLDMKYADSFLVGEQFHMKPRDVIYVASSKVAQWNRVLNQILPSLQSLFFVNTLK